MVTGTINLMRKAIRELIATHIQKHITWNYRVIQEEDGFRVAQIYYEDGEPVSFTDGKDCVLNYWDTYEDLERTAAEILDAFHKPYLVEVQGKLVEPYIHENNA